MTRADAERPVWVALAAVVVLAGLAAAATVAGAPAARVLAGPAGLIVGAWAAYRAARWAGRRGNRVATARCRACGKTFPRDYFDRTREGQLAHNCQPWPAPTGRRFPT